MLVTGVGHVLLKELTLKNMPVKRLNPRSTKLASYHLPQNYEYGSKWGKLAALAKDAHPKG